MQRPERTTSPRASAAASGEDMGEVGVGAGAERVDAPAHFRRGRGVERSVIAVLWGVGLDQTLVGAEEGDQRAHLVGAIVAGGADERPVVQQREDAAVEEGGGDGGGPR